MSLKRSAVIAALSCAPLIAQAQEAPMLRMTRADSLLDDGRWTEAEAVYYYQSRRAPRDPVARAALGRFLAMKGAVRPGMVLIEEAIKFGLDSAVGHALIAPLRDILEWRHAATELERDTIVFVRTTSNADALFQLPLPRARETGVSFVDPNSVSEIVWHDVVDRTIGLDSVNARSHPIGIEVLEGLVPSFDSRDSTLTLHANPRSALSAAGRRYQVLRTPSGVLVLLGDRRATLLADALRSLAPTWWQLDLLHGILVVRWGATQD